MLHRSLLLLLFAVLGWSADRPIVILDATNRPNVLPIGDNVLIREASNLVVGTATGSKLATSALQKLGAYGATPIVQPTGNVLTALGNLGWVSGPTLSAADLTSGTLAVARGGTGLASYAIGDLVYADGATSLAKLADVATGNALISGGVTTAPSWGKIGLTTHVSGTLAIANGGTASGTALSGSSIMVSNGSAIIQGSAGTSTTLLHGNASGVPTYSAVTLTTDVTGILPSANGGTGVNNAGTITTAANISFTGAGSFVTGGFTLTVPATGTAGLLGTAQSWTAVNTFSNATAASSSQTGAVVQNTGSASTSTGIGGGIVWAGTGFGVGVAPTSVIPFNVTLTSNSAISYTITNSSNGTGGQALFKAVNDGGKVVQYGVTSSGFTTFGALTASMGQMYSDAASGIVIMANSGSAPIIFAAGGSAASARVSSAGNLLVGTTADTGITGSGGLTVANTTSATSSILGAFSVGDRATAATSVAIGGGNINAGGTITSASLTSGRIPIVSTAGLLADSANLTLGSSNTVIGVRRTPHTWGANYGGVEFQGSALAEYYAAGNIQANWLGNAYDSGAGSYKYTDTDNANAFRSFPSSRLFTWATAPSGTSGTAITFVESMRLDQTALTVASTIQTISNNTTDSTSTTTGSLTTLGGMSFGVTKSAFGGGFKSTSATLGIGYATGAGGAVTQASSRTTGVTLNTVCGAITLVSAAGSATYQSFTVTDSACAANDVPDVRQKSGTDLYEIHVTAVAAGSFQVTFRTTGGTTTEQPVFNFVIFKGVNS